MAEFQINVSLFNFTQSFKPISSKITCIMCSFQLKKIEFAFQIANQSLFVSPIPALDKRLSRHGLEMQVKQFVARSLMYMALLLTVINLNLS